MSIIHGLLAQLQHYSGRYECHITVDLTCDSQFADFQEKCNELGAKALIIQLPTGNMQTQPMLSQYYQGDAQLVCQKIDQLYQSIAQDFTVVRLKVEADVDNQNIPQTDQAAQALPKACYFEHHVKMQLPKTLALQPLAAELSQYSGYLSRSALSSDIEGGLFELRFVTQRFRLGDKAAYQHLKALLNFLQTEKITVIKTIREFTIFDSNLSVDSGWTHDIYDKHE